ncbi:hypothetical protein ACFFGL_05875 [Mesonia maritima]
MKTIFLSEFFKSKSFNASFKVVTAIFGFVSTEHFANYIFSAYYQKTDFALI